MLRRARDRNEARLALALAQTTTATKRRAVEVVAAEATAKSPVKTRVRRVQCCTPLDVLSPVLCVKLVFGARAARRF